MSTKIAALPLLRWPTRDMLQIKKLLQIKSSCCKLIKVCFDFEIVAANFQNDLLQIKRMLLQIKTSKVCARTEERRSGY